MVGLGNGTLLLLMSCPMDRCGVGRGFRPKESHAQSHRLSADGNGQGEAPMTGAGFWREGTEV